MTTRAQPIFPGALWLLAGLLLAGEVWWVQQARHAARGALALLAERRQERDRLNRLVPSPTAASEQAIEKDLAAATKALATLRAEWTVPPSGAVPPAGGKTVDAYFEIAAFVEQMRIRAARAGVEVGPEEFFGFGSHRHQGPVADLLPAVCRQCRETQHALAILFEAQPRALLAVQRERPASAAKANKTAPGDDPGDYFEWPERLSLRSAGQVAGDAIRLEFTGSTSVLRRFLSRLVSDDWPIVVRSVEVEPLTPHEVLRPSVHSARPDAGAPLVAGGGSRFVVVVEYVGLAADAGKSSGS